MRKLIATLACRNKGSRLTSKPLQNLDIKSGLTILDYQISLLKSIPVIEGIVLAISEGEENLPFINVANKHKIEYIIGHEKDVLQRLILAGDKGIATDIFRVTTESPFTYYEKISEAWKTHLEGEYDATLMDHVPAGCGFEIIKLDSLKKSHYEGDQKHRSELCTLYLRENKNKFNLKEMPYPNEFNRKDLRLTVDYPEDLVLCRKVYENFKDISPRIPVGEIIKFLDENPEIKKIVEPYCDEVYNKLYK